MGSLWHTLIALDLLWICKKRFIAFSRLQPVAELPNCLSKSFCHSHMHKMGAEAYKSRSLALHIRIQNSMLRFLGIAQKLATYFIKIKVRRLWKTKGNQMKFNVCKVFWDNWMLVLQASCYAFSLSLFLLLSLCLTVHFARVFRAALPSTTHLPQCPRTVSCSLHSAKIVIQFYATFCHRIASPLFTLFLCFCLSFPVLPSHMIMRYSSLWGSSPNCQRHRHCAPLWTPQKPLKLRAA